MRTITLTLARFRRTKFLYKPTPSVLPYFGQRLYRGSRISQKEMLKCAKILAKKLCQIRGVLEVGIYGSVAMGWKPNVGDIDFVLFMDPCDPTAEEILQAFIVGTQMFEDKYGTYQFFDLRMLKKFFTDSDGVRKVLAQARRMGIKFDVVVLPLDADDEFIRLFYEFSFDYNFLRHLAAVTKIYHPRLLRGRGGFISYHPRWATFVRNYKEPYIEDALASVGVQRLYV